MAEIERVEWSISRKPKQPVVRFAVGDIAVTENAIAEIVPEIVGYYCYGHCCCGNCCESCCC